MYKGKLHQSECLYGDGNCYFRSISYILSGEEKFHLEVRRAVCDFISF